MVEQQSDTDYYYSDIERQFANCSVNDEVSDENYYDYNCSSREYNRIIHGFCEYGFCICNGIGSYGHGRLEFLNNLCGSNEKQDVISGMYILKKSILKYSKYSNKSAKGYERII